MRGDCEALDDADIPLACALFAQVFGHSIEPRHWRWKYQQGPRLAGLNLVLRHPDGSLLGHVGASVFAGQLQGRRVPMAQLSDVMVAPGARGGLDTQGVYARLMRSMQHTLQQRFPGVFAYGFVGIRPYRLGSRMGLYQARHECRAGLLPSDAPVGWRERISSAHPIDWQQALTSGLFERLGSQAVRTIQRPLLVRNSAYMQWRYAQHPQHSYQLWGIRTLGCTSGWVVTRCMPSGQHTLIDQWPVPPAALAQGASLTALSAVARALQATDRSRPVQLSAWSIDTPQSRGLEPVIGVEFKVGGWHTGVPAPVFVPGDTDVF